MIAGIEMACDVKLKSILGAARSSVNACHRSVFGGIDEQHAFLIADQFGVLEQKLITPLQLCARAEALRLKPIDERPAQTVVLPTHIADAIDQTGVVVEVVESHEPDTARTRSLITFPAGS